jgi:peptide deformylase
MIRDLVRYGDPRLLAANEPAAAMENLEDLLADMIQTCHAAPGIGLAAPQIGVNRRVAVIDLSVGTDPASVLVLVDPSIVEESGQQKEEEGCLSIPDFAERIIRPARVKVQAADSAGTVRQIEATGLLARALCHEIDHLDGILFVDRLRGIKKELTWRKIERRRAKELW